MQMTLIKNTDLSPKMTTAYKIARIVYAESGGISLPLVTAFTSMIKNLADSTGMSFTDIIQNKNIFPALDSKNPRHAHLYVRADNRAFQMCVRTAYLMLSGGLADTCYGATMFHHADELPQWATSRGYIADIDNVLFYA